MNPSLISVLTAPQADRRGFFLATANRLGVPFQHIEKDFWVCVVLDVLFNDREKNSPRLLFKGGTSLSKAYGLISRFSEDIDITVFREDLDLGMQLEALEALSGKQRKKYAENIKQASLHYICQSLKPHLQAVFDGLYQRGNVSSQVPRVELDPSDVSGQRIMRILFWMLI